MNVYLKIKIKSLAAEAAIIRKEERRHSGGARTSLHQHRVLDVRREARSALLAYGFLRGRSYLQMERSARRPPNWPRIESLVKKYGADDMRERMERFAKWREAAAAPADLAQAAE